MTVATSWEGESRVARELYPVALQQARFEALFSSAAWVVLAAVSLYALINFHSQRARAGFVIVPLTARQARIIGVLGLLVAGGLLAASVY